MAHFTENGRFVRQWRGSVAPCRSHGQQGRLHGKEHLQ